MTKLSSSARRGTPEPSCTFATDAGKNRFFAIAYDSREVSAVNTSADPPGETIAST